MTQYNFRGFTKKGKRKSFLRFLESLKEGNLKFKVRDKDDESYSVDGCSLYGASGSLNYIFFRDNNYVPKTLIKKYATKTPYGILTIFTVLIIGFILLLSSSIYNNYVWNEAPTISGDIEDIKENCYLSRGAFSASNKVCETTEIRIDGQWYENIGNGIYSVGQEVDIKCLEGKCK